MGAKHWNDDEERAVKRMAKSGKTAEQMAEELDGRNAKAIQRKLRLMGLAGESDGTRWQPWEIDRLRGAVSTGQTAEDIVKVLPNRSLSAVKTKMSELRAAQRVNGGAHPAGVNVYEDVGRLTIAPGCPVATKVTVVDGSLHIHIEPAS